MSYRIQYESIPKRQILKSSVIRRGVLTVFCFGLFLMAVFYVWPDVLETVHPVLEPFRQVQMVGAFNEMAHVLRDGTGIMQAIETILHQVLQEMGFDPG